MASVSDDGPGAGLKTSRLYEGYDRRHSTTTMTSFTSVDGILLGTSSHKVGFNLFFKENIFLPEARTRAGEAIFSRATLFWGGEQLFYAYDSCRCNRSVTTPTHATLRRGPDPSPTLCTGDIFPSLNRTA